MKRYALLLAVSCCLAGCGGSNTPVLDNQGNPTGGHVQSNNDGLLGFIGGALVGNMLGGSNRQAAPTHTTVNRTVIIKEAPRQPQVAPAPKPTTAPRPSFSKPTPSVAPKAPTFSYTPRPSYSPSYRSSGGRR